jgi:choloylglycine hydrolase
MNVNRLIVGTAVAAALALSSQACTRVMHVFKKDHLTLTARSMDWYVRYPTTLWKFPRGMEKSGLARENPLKWRSRYGSLTIVQTSEGQAGATDGINEKGLVANLLYLTETRYPKRNPEMPGVATSIYLQYILDNFATVAEAVAALRKDAMQIVPVPIPGSEHLPTMHFALSDATGDSAIVEFLDGRTVIHHDRSYQVMANTPVYEKQLALNAYWDEIGGNTFLPGTRKSPDRFVRASFYNKMLPEPKSYLQAVASLFSVIRNASSPFGEADPEKPNISMTMWRVVHDQTNLRLFYESTEAPNVVWVDLKTFDFSEGSGTRSVALDDTGLVGDISGRLEPAPALKFAAP